jgi:hypothetical protein
MKIYIIIAVILVFFFIIKDFDVTFLRTSYNSDTEYFDIDFMAVQAGDWYGSLLYLQYHGGEFEWDFLFLNSKISKIRG